MKNSLIIVSALILMSTSSNAQVGIGTATPNAQSILDLTNSNNKYVVLPISSVTPGSIPSIIEGAVIYYQGNMYLQTANGIKVFTPWRWDGDSTHFLSSPQGAPLGIGVIPQTTNYVMQVANPASGDITASSGSHAAIIIGDPIPVRSTHMELDSNEIMVKNTQTTAGILTLQKDGGTVQIRTTAATTASTVLKANGSVDASGSGKIREHGNDLLPVGSIIMWNGAAVPAGWALCDGGTYTLMAGGTTTTPNLMDRFIVGANATGGTGTAGSYTQGNTGGENSHVLTIAEMPAHDHGGSVSGGAHTHTFTDAYSSSSCKNGVFASSGGCFMTLTSDVTQTSTTTAGDGAHTHTVSSQGGGAAHENRPPYYALAYIMKL